MHSPSSSLEPATAEPDPHQPVYMGLPAYQYLLPRFGIALALSLPVMVLAMGGMLAPAWAHQLGPRLNGWLQFALTTPVFFWCGAPFIRRWWISLRERDTNMFTLIVTGTGAAYFYSVAAVLFGERFPATLRTAHGVPLYFEGAAVITTVETGASRARRTGGRCIARCRGAGRRASRPAGREGAG